MPDYIYLLENRLSADQQSALRHLREVALEVGTIPVSHRGRGARPDQRPCRSRS